MTRQRPLLPKIALLPVLLVLLAGATACGSTPAQDSPSPGEPAPTVTVPIPLPITISLAGNFSRERLAALDALIARYEAIHSEVRVEVVRAPKDSIQRRAWIRERLDDEDTSLDIYLLDATLPRTLFPLAAGSPTVYSGENIYLAHANRILFQTWWRAKRRAHGVIKNIGRQLFLGRD